MKLANAHWHFILSIIRHTGSTGHIPLDFPRRRRLIDLQFDLQVKSWSHGQVRRECSLGGG